MPESSGGEKPTTESESALLLMSQSAVGRQNPFPHQKRRLSFSKICKGKEAMGMVAGKNFTFASTAKIKSNTRHRNLASIA